MNAIRRDEDLDNIHSIYVDQWDWEKVIKKDDRTIEYLEKTVRKIYSGLLKLERFLALKYDFIKEELPEEITFITSDELLKLYPDKSPKEREYLFVKEKKAVFIEKIGGKLKDGKPHDLRSPDYDDWNLNGDLFVYYPLLDIALELSSMGIRVDKEALLTQLEKTNLLERAKLPFHQDIINEKLPYTIGGGIGQSRLCMFFLKKAHIGEVQCSLWDDETIKICNENDVFLL